MAGQHTACTQTLIQNSSGETLFFSFLPPHGFQLAPNAQKNIPGNLIEILANWGGRANKPRKFNAMMTALLTGVLSIIHTPGVFLYDHWDQKTRLLYLKRGVLGDVDPCWSATSSYAPA